MNVKSIKKGFTLTELIIVIVIIGILAGVLIPTFINVVNKANKAADLSLIRNLNEALTLDRYDRGEHKHMTAALEAVEEYGYEVEKIDAKVSKNKILWDSENDVFCYLVGEDTLEYYPNSVSKEIHLDDPKEAYLLWIIDNKVNSKFSTYYYSESDEIVDLIEVENVGFDAGKSNILKIDYTGNKGNTVIIRTNGGTLTIEALSDSVHHYGKASLVDIKAINTSSYHEFGQIEYAQIKTGRIVIEDSKASIENLLLVAKSRTEGFDDIIVETKEGAEVPSLDRTDVEISENGTLVFNLVTPETDEYIYLTKAGVVEQIIVVEAEVIPENVEPDNVDALVAALDAGVYSPNVDVKSDTTQTAAEQIANVGKKNPETGNYVDSNGDDIDLDVLTSETIVPAETKAADRESTIGTTFFSGGVGTEKSPFLVSTKEQFRLIGASVKVDNSTVWLQKYSFKVIADLELELYQTQDAFGNYWMTGLKYFDVSTGLLDGNNHTITIMNESDMDACLFLIVENNPTIKNLNVNMYGNNLTLCSFTKNVNLENIVINGDVTWDSSNCGILTDRVYCEGSSVKFYATNITNNANISVVGGQDYYDAVFVGLVGNGGTSCVPDIRFINCVNNGTFVGQRAAMYIANPNAYTIDVKIENCVNNGLIRALNNNANYFGNLYYALPSNCYTAYRINGYSYKIQGSNIVQVPSPSDDVITKNIGLFDQSAADNTLAIHQNADQTFTITPATNEEVVKYVVYVGLYTTVYTDEGNTNGSARSYVTEEIESSELVGTTQIKNLDFVDMVWVGNHSEAIHSTFGDFDIYTCNGVSYYLVNNSYSIGSGGQGLNGQPKSAEMISVVGYDSAGKPICSAMLEID